MQIGKISKIVAEVKHNRLVFPEKTDSLYKNTGPGQTKAWRGAFFACLAEELTEAYKKENRAGVEQPRPVMCITVPCSFFFYWDILGMLDTRKRARQAETSGLTLCMRLTNMCAKGVVRNV